MMKENDVASISEQFGLDKEIVEASAEDGTLGQRIKDSLKDKKIYSNEEFEQFQTNYKTEVVNSYFNELVEKAKQGDIPQNLYAPVKGAAYQQLERELSKELGVSEYKDVKDLISKAVKSSANEKTDADLLRKLEELKEANIRLNEEKENAVQTVEQKYKSMNLEREKASILNSVPFDFSNVKPDELDSVKAKTQTLLKSVFDAEYKLDYEGDKVVVKRGDEIIKNDMTRDPVPAKDVIFNLAKEYNLKLTSPDSGGQGGKSSAGSKAVYADVAEFEADMEAKGISRTDPQYIKMYRESGLSKYVK